MLKTVQIKNLTVRIILQNHSPYAKNHILNQRNGNLVSKANILPTVRLLKAIL